MCRWTASVWTASFVKNLKVKNILVGRGAFFEDGVLNATNLIVNNDYGKPSLISYSMFTWYIS